MSFFGLFEKKEETKTTKYIYECAACGKDETTWEFPEKWTIRAEGKLCDDCGYVYFHLREKKSRLEKEKAIKKSELAVKKAIKKGVLKL